MVEGDDLYQIELNTISASLAGLSSNLAKLRRSQYTGIPENEAAYNVARGMRRAIQEYCSQFDLPCASALFIVQEAERNVFDQQEISDALTAMGIRVIRKPLASTFQVEADGVLRLESQEIGLIYFRAGYSPDEYTTEAHWKAREVLETSRAIKCPDIAAHLAGLKKIQQVLTDESELERVMLGDAHKTRELLTCFAKIYSLDPADPQTLQSIQMAVSDPEKFVLKPQREGGGNNIYGADIKTALSSLTPAQLSAYILMQRIRPAITAKTPILRNGQESQIEAVSELGIYGFVLARNYEIIENETCGWLLRTKPVECDEGGLITGYSVLDCPSLVQFQ
jgi:glutathione synthetase